MFFSKKNAFLLFISKKCSTFAPAFEKTCRHGLFFVSQALSIRGGMEANTPGGYVFWKDGRVVDYTGLENRRAERHRGFESLSFRRKETSRLFFLCVQWRCKLEKRQETADSLAESKFLHYLCIRFLP